MAEYRDVFDCEARSEAIGGAVADCSLNEAKPIN